MKSSLLFLFLAVTVWYGCNESKQKKPVQVTEEETTANPGALAFLLDDNQKTPEEVGFLTHPVIKQRLAQLMKDSFSVLSSKTKFSQPLSVSKQTGLVMAKFYFDKQRTDLSAVIIVDALRDVFWVYYYNGNVMVKFADNSSTADISL